MAERFTVIVSKADPAYLGIPIIDMCIEIVGALPEFDDLADAIRYYDGQAQQIEETLHRALPGGVYDRLVGRMLTRKASHFRIAHFDESEETDGN